MSNDFNEYIKEDIETGILLAYLPEGIIINQSIQTDNQVKGSLKMMKNQKKFNNILYCTGDMRQDNKKMLADASEEIVVVSSDEGGTKIKMGFLECQGLKKLHVPYKLKNSRIIKHVQGNSTVKHLPRLLTTFP